MGSPAKLGKVRNTDIRLKMWDSAKVQNVFKIPLSVITVISFKCL